MSTSSNNKQISSIYDGHATLSGQPTIMSPTSVQTIPAPLRLSWYEMQQKNKPQGYSLVPGYLILAVAGSQIAWGSFRYPFDIGTRTWLHLYMSKSRIYHMIVSYFVGTLIGSIVSATTVNKLEKKVFYNSSCALIMFGSILILACNNYDGIIAARYFIGLGVGLTFIPYVIHGSEVAVKELRGTLLGGGNFLIVIGMFCIAFISAIYVRVVKGDEIVDLVFAGIFIAWSILAVIVCFFATLESPAFHIQKGEYQTAKDVMMKLRNETCETDTLTQDYNELNTMINEDMLRNGIILTDGNIQPLLIITLLRGVYALTMCRPLNLMMCIYLESYLNSVDGPKAMETTILLGCRLLMEIFACVLIDKIPRRLILLLSGVISGIILTITGILILTETSSISIAIFCILYQLVVGFGLGSVSLTLMGEVFATKKKVYSIFFVTSVEVAIQLLTTYFGMYFAYESVFSGNIAVAIGPIQIFAIGSVYYLLPETLKLSLAECRRKM